MSTCPTHGIEMETIICPFCGFSYLSCPICEQGCPTCDEEVWVWEEVVYDDEEEYDDEEPDDDE